MVRLNSHNLNILFRAYMFVVLYTKWLFVGLFLCTMDNDTSNAISFVSVDLPGAAMWNNMSMRTHPNGLFESNIRTLQHDNNFHLFVHNSIFAFQPFVPYHLLAKQNCQRVVDSLFSNKPFARQPSVSFGKPNPNGVILMIDCVSYFMSDTALKPTHVLECFTRSAQNN